MTIFIVIPHHCLAESISSNGLEGYAGVYFKVLKSDSEYGLSSLTLGRLKLGIIPNFCSVVKKVAPFTGEPLSQCKVT